jgi:hypothetical protein
MGMFGLLLLIYLPLFIDTPDLTIPELKSLVVGEKVHEGYTPYAQLIDSTAPLTAWIYGFVDMMFGRSLVIRHILGFLILFSQSAFLGMMFINRKAFSENTYIPSFLFSIIAFFSFDTFVLSGELFGSGFLLLALNNLFKEIEFRTQRSETVFNIGLFISLASLCSFSFVMHLLSVCAIMIFYTRGTPRGFLLLILGFLVPQLIMMSLYYLNSSLPQLWEFYYLPNLSTISEKLISTSSMLALGFIPLLYLLISVVMLNREARFSKYQSQLLQGMFFWMMLSFMQILYSNDYRPQNFIILIPSLCFFITHFILMIRRRKFAEMNAWILIIGIVGTSYLARYDKLDSVNYNQLRVVNKNTEIKGKKILMLDHDISIYSANTLATPFFNWNLSRLTFEHPDYYENIISVHQAFKADPPEVIIDKHQVMPEFMERIPLLKNNYVLKRPGMYIRRGTGDLK